MKSRCGHAAITAAVLLLTAAELMIAAGTGVTPRAPVPTQTSQSKPDDQFQTRITRATRALATDLKAAVEALDRLAVESIELRKTRALTPAERAVHRQLFVVRARGHLKSADNEKVDDSYRELLRIDPLFNATLPPAEQEKLDQLKSRESGMLEISCRIRDCQILVDGSEVGITGEGPVRVPLIAGAYDVRLEKTGLQPAVMRVTVAATQTLVISTLAPRAAVPPLAYLSDRPGVGVFVDNIAAGETVRIADLKSRMTVESSAALDQALAVARLDAATAAGVLLTNPPVDRPFTVRFRGDCLIDEIRSLSITADMLSLLSPDTALLWLGDSNVVRMRPDVGTMRVTSIPTAADVYIDGRLAGKTPLDASVCSGERHVRIRNAIGSYAVTAVITRGTGQMLDVTLKPGLGFLGAVETTPAGRRQASDVNGAVDRALAASIRSFRLAAPVDLPPDSPHWTDADTASLVAASDRGDADGVKKLLKLARDTFDAPLLLAAAVRGGNGSGDAPVDILLFWHEHAGVDRVQVLNATTEGLIPVFEQLDRTADPLQMVYRNDLAFRAADTQLPDAPLVVVSADAGTPSAMVGVRAGDCVLAVDGSPMTAAQVAETLSQKKAGDLLTLRVAGAGTGAREVTAPVQRRPQRAPAIDTFPFGNSLVAKLQMASAGAAAGVDRELYNFNLALLYMRFGEWRHALDLLSALGPLPPGDGVSSAAATFFRARCHVELGERDRAIALLQEVAGDTHVLTDDGATVGALAKLRLSTLK